MKKYLADEDNYSNLIHSLLEKAQERGELRKDIALHHIGGHFYGLYLLLISAWFSGRVKTEEAETALETLFRQALEGMHPRPERFSQRIPAMFRQPDIYMSMICYDYSDHSHPQTSPPGTVEAILSLSLAHPMWGCVRLIE